MGGRLAQAGSRTVMATGITAACKNLIVVHHLDSDRKPGCDVVALAAIRRRQNVVDRFTGCIDAVVAAVTTLAGYRTVIKKRLGTDRKTNGSMAAFARRCGGNMS